MAQNENVAGLSPAKAAELLREARDALIEAERLVNLRGAEFRLAELREIASRTARDAEAAVQIRNRLAAAEHRVAALRGERP